MNATLDTIHHLSGLQVDWRAEYPHCLDWYFRTWWGPRTPERDAEARRFEQ